MKAVLGTITAFLSEKQKFNCWGGKKGSQVETHNLFAYHDCLKELSTLFITVSLFTGVGYVHLPVMFNYCIFPLLGCLPYQTFVCMIESHNVKRTPVSCSNKINKAVGIAYLQYVP